AAPVGQVVARRKVTQESVTDVASFRLHRDRLGDGKVAAALDRHVADEIENALGRASGAKRGQQENERRGDAGEDRHGLPPGKTTCGAAAWARSSSSKNGSSWKPSGRATSTPGNDWMLMLRLRTAPL